MPKRVLIIDDDEIIRRAYRDFFSYHKIQVDTADNGWQGVELYRANHFDAVILDMLMPFWDGQTVLEILLSIDNSVPIFVVSACFDIEAIKNVIRNHAVDYIIKPPDFDKLLNQLHKACH